MKQTNIYDFVEEPTRPVKFTKPFKFKKYAKPLFNNDNHRRSDCRNNNRT